MKKCKSSSKILLKWNQSFFSSQREKSWAVVKISSSQTQACISISLRAWFSVDFQPTHRVAVQSALHQVPRPCERNLQSRTKHIKNHWEKASLGSVLCKDLFIRVSEMFLINLLKMKIPGWSPKVILPGFWGEPPGICVLANTSGGFAMSVWGHPLRSRVLLCGASPLRWHPFIKWTWIRLLLPGTVPGAGGAGPMPEAASVQAEGFWGGWWDAVQGSRS